MNLAIMTDSNIEFDTWYEQTDSEPRKTKNNVIGKVWTFHFKNNDVFLNVRARKDGQTYRALVKITDVISCDLYPEYTKGEVI